MKHLKTVNKKAVIYYYITYRTRQLHSGDFTSKCWPKVYANSNPSFANQINLSQKCSDCCFAQHLLEAQLGGLTSLEPVQK